MDSLKLLSKNRRQWNARAALGTPNGTEFHIGWVNYRKNGIWTSINTIFDVNFEVTDGPFSFKAPLYADGIAEIYNNNEFNVFAKTAINTTPFVQRIKALGVDHVEGQLFDINGNGRLDAVIYRNAYNSASFTAHLVYYVEHGRAPRLKKLIQFDQSPPTDVQAEFEIEWAGGSKPELSPKNIPDGYTRESWRDKWDYDFKNDQTNTLLSLHDKGGCYIRPRDETQLIGGGIKIPMIWDSNNSIAGRKTIAIEAYLKHKSGNVWTLVKIIPKSFFSNVVYPVYTDTTSTFFPDPDPETNTVDGWLLKEDNGGTPWDTAHDALIGDAVNDTNLTVITSAQNRTVQGATFFRSAYYFDTSSISISDLISLTTFSFYPTTVNDSTNDGDDFITAIQVQGNNIVSDVALNIADYDLVGDAIDNPTEGNNNGDRLDLTSLVINAYNDLIFNNTGIGWVAKNGQQKPSGGTPGITYIGTREGHDILDNEIPPGGVLQNNRVVMSSADEVGTSQDPKLVVVHAPSGRISRYHNLNGLGGQGQMTWNPLG
jgi:hypothetical protein